MAMILGSQGVNGSFLPSLRNIFKVIDALSAKIRRFIIPPKTITTLA